MKKSNWDNKNTQELIAAMLSLQTATQAKRFLRDLMTEAELIEFGNRWRAAQMLAKGDIYTEISRETGLSSRTIARISKWLQSGMGGYQSLIKSTHHHAHIRTSSGAV
jgi:TrpR-related protein YerC/YecD